MVLCVVMLFFSLLYLSGLSTGFRSLLDNSAVVHDAALEWQQLKQVLAEEARPALALKKRGPASYPRGWMPQPDHQKKSSQLQQTLMITPQPLSRPAALPTAQMLPEFVRVPASKDLKDLFRPEEGARKLPAPVKQMLLVTAPPAPAPTTRPPQFEVLCHIDRMYVRVRRDLFSTFNAYKDLKLGSCLVNQATKDHYYLLYLLLSDCGFQKESNADDFLYSIDVHYKPDSSNGIVREMAFDVPIQCSYHRIHHSFRVGYRPELPEPVFRPLNSQHTGISLTAKDESGNDVSSFTIGMPMCFEAKLSSPMPGDRVYINECFVTDAPDRESTPKYTVIDNQGCMTDGMLSEQSKFLVSPRTQQKFCIGAFRFKQTLSKPSKLMYLHCEIAVGKWDATESLKACNFDLRTRRWNELYGQRSICSCCSESDSCSAQAQPRTFRTMVSSPAWKVDGGRRMDMTPQFKNIGPKMEVPENYADFLDHWENDYS